jgi:uncharacterized protein YijF (DUF1287 family)
MSSRVFAGFLAVFVATATLAGCSGTGSSIPGATDPAVESSDRPSAAVADRATPKARALAQAAADQVGRTVTYDAAYVVLDYPGGDVPVDRGVCTDVVIRAMRDVGNDLQVAVHEDMTRASSAYPKRWRLKKPDPNIDHRRVPNLRVFFERSGKQLPVTTEPVDYQPGDIVTWELAGGLPHTGIVSTQRSADGRRFCIVHNIGGGTRIEDALFEFEITGHYRWF